ncbi:MAG: AAA family ATPase [Lachnospiraceae bacterium]|nr:AAA family ATPase [Lachnospiraceae bacterium]
MKQIFIKKVNINKVRHLTHIDIPVSDQRMKHLILTGKNGSGKTSLLNAICGFLDSLTTDKKLGEAVDITENRNGQYNATFLTIIDSKKRIVEKASQEILLEMNLALSAVYQKFQEGDFVVAYYRADRVFKADIPEHVEKVNTKDHYSIKETPRTVFVKYLLDMEVTESIAASKGMQEKAEKIRLWFDEFQKLLRKIFDDDSLQLNFDIDTFQFSIVMKDREPFDFNTLSSGYAAILDIVVDLIIRMDKKSDKVFDFSMPGIVLIDEIETHLHMELQKNILPFLTTLFPNVQFIVSTHSPFILNSLENVAIYDLENRLLVENGLSDIPYSGIVEGYFNANELSDTLKAKYERYKELAAQPELSDEDMDELSGLELYLDEIPDYLALDIATEYRRLKQELRVRGDF